MNGFLAAAMVLVALLVPAAIWLRLWRQRNEEDQRLAILKRTGLYRAVLLAVAGLFYAIVLIVEQLK